MAPSTEFVTVESEHSAMSATVGAARWCAAAGHSVGLSLMEITLWPQSSLIVMPVVNRLERSDKYPL